MDPDNDTIIELAKQIREGIDKQIIDELRNPHIAIQKLTERNEELTQHIDFLEKRINVMQQVIHDYISFEQDPKCFAPECEECRPKLK